jgi:hypothetical protein
VESSILKDFIISFSFIGCVEMRIAVRAVFFHWRTLYILQLAAFTQKAVFYENHKYY